MSPSDCQNLTGEQALGRIAALEDELRQLRQEVQQTERLAALGMLAAGVAHEINNLLTPALAYAQLAQSRSADEKMLRKAIDRAATGIGASTRILQATLHFASPERVEARVAVVDEALQAALDCLARDPAKDGISLIRRIPPGATVAIEPLKLQQVFINLLLNAVRVLRRQGGEIVFAASAEADGHTIVTVTDNGPGIPGEIAARLFEPFVSYPVPGEQTDGRRSEQGSGLGLAVCQRAIESAGGTIVAGNRDSGGAVFTITLASAAATELTRVG